MATNRPDTLDPALMRPGRLDRKVEFNVPELEGRTQILQIHAKSMSCDRNIRFELIARLCPNTTGSLIWIYWTIDDYLSIYLSIYHSIYLSINISIYISIYVPPWFSLYMWPRTTIYLS
jgi:hypothetical protein